MDYPLYYQGSERGRLRMEQAGLYTLVEAQLDGVQEQLVRLWLHGGGECAYLGLMQPWSGGMYLRRKFSRNDMEKFPKSIRYASDEGSANDAEKAEEPAAAENSAPACPWPAEIAPESGELLWYRRTDGSLVSHDGISSLVALPSALREQRPGAVLRWIEGREYIVFRY